jgi:hypothetical protein
LAFKLDEDYAVVNRILILVLPAISGGLFLNYTLQASLKLRSAPRLIKVRIIFILGAAVYFIFFQNFLRLVNKWSLAKWVLGSIWLLPLFRAVLPVRVNAISRIPIPKIFDRGALGLQTILLNNYFNLRRLKGAPYVYVYKIIGLIII